MITSPACVTHGTEIGDYTSWMTLRNIRLQLFVRLQLFFGSISGKLMGPKN
jgi:hypothetical protein